MRLIDADGSYTINASDNTGYSLAFDGGIIVCADDIGRIEAEFFTNDIPLVDAAPVAHGEWEVVDLLTLEHGEVERAPKSALRCSVCSYAFDKGLLWAANFCPHCGAKMDLGSGD